MRDCDEIVARSLRHEEQAYGTMGEEAWRHVSVWHSLTERRDPQHRTSRSCDLNRGEHLAIVYRLLSKCEM